MERIKVRDWIGKNKIELALLMLILLLAAFLRLYRISEYMMFLGDEGRDVMVVRRLLVDHDLIFVGPGTSVGNMYLGPLYYYMMAPALWLANYSPVGPAIQIALLGVLTVGFVWYLARLWAGRTGALMAALLYAVSPVVIFYSRSSWNPNIMPFFALLCIFSLWKIWHEENWQWIIVLSVALGFISQSHYLGLLLLPTVGLFWFLAKKNKLSIRYSLFAILLLVILTLPLVLFDAKYHWRNFDALNKFLFSTGGDFSFRVGRYLPKLWLVWEKLNIRLLAGTSVPVGEVFAVGLAIYLTVMIFIRRRFSSSYYLLLSWIGFGLLGLALYKGEVYDHYLGFLFPAIFILFALFVKNIQQNTKSKVVRFLPYVLCFILLVLSLANSSFKNEPNRQLGRTMAVSAKIKEEAKGNKYNFAVIADKNYEGAYQYFLEMWKTNISIIDPQRYEETVADQLFVICEYEDQTTCHPTSNPKAEVANFGWSKIDREWEVGGLKLFKLVHNVQN